MSLSQKEKKRKVDKSKIFLGGESLNLVIEYFGCWGEQAEKYLYELSKRDYCNLNSGEFKGY